MVDDAIKSGKEPENKKNFERKIRAFLDILSLSNAHIRILIWTILQSINSHERIFS